MKLQVLTKDAIDKVVLSRVDLDTNESSELLTAIATSGVSWLDKFSPLHSKTYRLDIEFSRQADPNAQIDVYVNDSSLIKAQSIVFAYGTMLESLEKFYKLIGALENDVWWVDEHIDKDCFEFLNGGINKEKVKNIRILGGPVHINERFRRRNKGAQRIRDQVTEIWDISTKWSNWSKIKQKRDILTRRSPF